MFLNKTSISLGYFIKKKSAHIFKALCTFLGIDTKDKSIQVTI